MVQLTRAHPRLYHPFFTYQLHHGLMLLCLNRFSLNLLVVRLPADADKATCLTDAYLNSFFLGEGTFKGFFGSLTPYSF